MTTLNQFTNRIAVALVAFSVGMAACSKSNPSELPMTTPVMHDTRPWCIGRFVVDLPHDAEVYNQEYKYMGYSIDVAKNLGQQEFVRRVEAREHELKTKLRVDPHNSFSPTKTPWLHQAVQPNDYSRLFVFGRYDVPPAELSYDVEGYAWSHDTQFTLKNKFGDGYDQSAVQNASEILRNIRPRDEGDVPNDGAFCFNGGLIGGKQLPAFDATVAAGLVPGRPSNLIVKLRESVAADQKASLLSGLSEFEAQLKPYAGHYKVLRKGKRQVAGIQAEEILVDIHEDGVQKYQFYLLAAGVEGDPSKPHTAIQLLFGAEPDAVNPASVTTSPVNEEQAVQAWDTVLNSFHYRGAEK